MSLKKPAPLGPLICLSLLIWASGCVSIAPYTLVSVKGDLSAGGGAAPSNTTTTEDLSFSEMLDFIDAQPARTCVPVPGLPVCADDQTKGVPVALPARGGAIMMSSKDWTQLKTELQAACRMLKSACSYQTQALLGLK